jgi:hypothetical protein
MKRKRTKDAVMSGFTQGPWQFNPERGDITAPSVPKESSRLGRGDDRDEIWNYYGGELVAETVSACDGPLLTAALELYQALRALRSFMWAQGYADQTAEMAQADAAIAKVEARSKAG